MYVLPQWKKKEKISKDSKSTYIVIEGESGLKDAGLILLDCKLLEDRNILSLWMPYYLFDCLQHSKIPS